MLDACLVQQRTPRVFGSGYWKHAKMDVNAGGKDGDDVADFVGIHQTWSNKVFLSQFMFEGENQQLLHT